MKHDEFAFFNQQLSGMLKSGIPLEGALRQLCDGMRRGSLRNEIEKLERDLAEGTSLQQALAARQFPEFYKQMLLVGAKSNDFPGVLTLIADYYQRSNSLWTRLKALMVYPVIVLVMGLAVSIFIFIILGSASRAIMEVGIFSSEATGYSLILFTPVLVLLFGIVAFSSIFIFPGLRNLLRWRMSGFKEASIANFAETLRLLLKNGSSLPEALSFLAQIERRSALGAEIQRWQNNLASGRAKISDLASQSKILPPLFFWLIASEGEDWPTGLGRVADIYYQRAMHKSEMLLFAVLPIATIVLGVFIVGQILPMLWPGLSPFIQLMDLGN